MFRKSAPVTTDAASSAREPADSSNSSSSGLSSSSILLSSSGDLLWGIGRKHGESGGAVEEAKATAMQKLYDFLEIDVAPKNDSLYESAVGYAVSTLFLVDFVNDYG